MRVFVDTNILLNEQFNFDNYKDIYISIKTIEELDNLKNSDRIGYMAREAIRKLKSADNVNFLMNPSANSIPFLENNNDNIILSHAVDICNSNDDVIFLTNDYNLYLKARSLNLPSEIFECVGSKEVYTGYKEVTLSDKELAEFYQEPKNNWELFNNQYLIITDNKGEIIDKQKWTDDKGFTTIGSRPLKSIYFPDFKPRDIYQMLAIDSLNKDEMTLLYGEAGTAKTYCSLSWIMQNIHNGKINQCVIIFNPAKLKGSEQLGYYSGNRTEKLLQNSIGGILSSKLGDMMAVESLINSGKLMVIPTSDIRGIEISDNSCLYVTEAQNTDAYTMRTILQRAKEGCKVIIEGDMLEQQDIRSGENGMQRIIDVFKGSKYFSCVKLQNVYRSPIAELAQRVSTTHHLAP